MNLDDALEDMGNAFRMSDYEAVDVLWVALVKISNHMPGSNEHKRMLALADQLPPEDVRELLHLKEMDDLLNFDPPLETIITNENERTQPDKIAEAISNIRRLRHPAPKDALLNLAEILKRIRNKRAHGFKKRTDPRDSEILKATRMILQKLCEISVATCHDEK